MLARTSAPANPIGLSSASSRGTKPTDSRLYYSVGQVSADPNTYMTMCPDGSAPVATIKCGILEFFWLDGAKLTPWPQTHAYVGVGDRVATSDGTYYLKSKITCQKWTATNIIGNVPESNDSPLEVLSINKSFSKISLAIDSVNLNLGSKDLVDKQIGVGIACYAGAIAETDLSISGWTTNEFFNINIFAPSDIKSECNSNQKHNGIKESGVVVTLTSTSGSAFSISNDYTTVEGIEFLGVNTSTSLIQINNSYCKILRCIARDCYYAINNESEHSVIAFNFIYDFFRGIYNGTGSRYTKIFNNTVFAPGGVTGIAIASGVVDTALINCVIETSTCIYNLGVISVSNTITSDTTGTIPSTTLVYRDRAQRDLRLAAAIDKDDAAVRGGLDYSDNGEIDIDFDGCGIRIDSTWSIGAHHRIPTARFAVGPNVDIGSGGNASISDSIVTFVSAQNDDEICSGCKVTFGSDPTKVYLGERVSDTVWTVVNDVGMAVPDVASAAFTIKPPYQTLAAALSNYEGKDFVTDDLSVVIHPTSGSDTTHADWPECETDITRNIKVIVPNDTGDRGNCKTSRRHSGVFDPDKYNLIVDSYLGAIMYMCDYATIEGMQIIAEDGDCIDVTGTNVVIRDCILKSIQYDAIGFRQGWFPGHDNKNASIYIIDNLIYDCGRYGITLFDDNYLYSHRLFIYNNTVYGCMRGINIETDTTANPTHEVALINNLCIGNRDRDYSINHGRSSSVIAISCWSSDDSIKRFAGYLNEINSEIRFANVGNNDFRISLLDKLSMVGAIDLSSDPFFQFDDDIQGQARPGQDWGVGCDNYVATSDETAIFSVGAETGSLVSAPATVKITNGILEIIGGAVDPRIGVGDKVVYDGTNECYLAERGSDRIWKAVNGVGGIVVDTAAVDLVSVKRCFNTIAEAVGASGAETIIGEKDLVHAGCGLRLECYYDSEGSKDSSPFTVSGWTASAAYPIVIETPYKDTQSRNSHRHPGAFSATAGYMIETAGDAVTIDDQDYCSILGFQILTTDDSDCVVISGSPDYVDIAYNIIAACDIGINAASVTSTTTNALFNIIFGYQTSGIAMASTCGKCYNNTVVDTEATPSSKAYDLAGAFDAKNCIASTGAGTGFGGGTNTNYKNCISSDASAGTANNCRTLVDIIFSDRDNLNFHIIRDDHFCVRAGYDVSAEFPQYMYDIDGVDFQAPYAIGADYLDVDDVDLFFSVGTSGDTSTHDDPLTVSIVSGVAEFSEKQTDSRFGIGNKIVYDVDSECFVVAKIDHWRWRVLTKYGRTPNNVTDKSVVGAYNPFETIAEPSLRDISHILKWFGNDTNPFSDFSATKYRINICVYKGVYEGIFNINNTMTSDENHYLRIFTPFDTRYQCNVSQRHDGHDSGSEATIYNTGSNAELVTISQSYVKFEGLCVDGDNNVGDAIFIDSLIVGVVVNGCIIKNSTGGIHHRGGTIDSVATINNCIIYSFSQYGIYDEYCTYINGCTVIGGQYGIVAHPYCVPINCIVQNSTVCFSYPWTKYCTASDGSITLHYYENQFYATVDFKDAPNHDYRLGPSLSLDYNQRGTASPDESLTSDATGAIRGRLKDRGAVEYIPSKSVVYSSGNNAGGNVNFITNPNNGKLSGIVNEINSTIEFSVPQTNENVGVGDKIYAKHSATSAYKYFYLKEKITNSLWVISDEFGQAPTLFGTYIIVSIRRAFTTPYIALLHFMSLFPITFTNNLIRIDTKLLIACYDGSQANVINYANGITCDCDRNLRIFTPRNVETECNKTQRHSGVWSNKFSIQTSSADYGIKFENANFIEIEGMQIKNLKSGGKAISLSSCKNSLVADNIVIGDGGGIEIITFSFFSDVIINNLIYSCVHGDGISIDSTNPYFYISSSYVMNNTVVGCRRGIVSKKISNSGRGSVSSWYNNICQGSVLKDFVRDELAHTSFNDLKNNISSDESSSRSGGTYNRINQNIVFSNRAQNIYQLSKPDDVTAIDNAIDLSGGSVFSFDYDIAYRTREPSYWDIGAFEILDIVGFGELIINDIHILSSHSYYSNIRPVLIVYLYSTPVPSHEFEYPTIPELNDFIKSVPHYNIIVYSQPDAVFAGTFDFGAHPLRTVSVSTDPYPEESFGFGHNPTSIEYGDDGLVADASAQLHLEFKNMKIYNDVNHAADYIVDGDTDQLRFINCILQMNADAIIDQIDCGLEIINCQLVYSNESDYTDIYLSKKQQDDEHLIKISNTGILADSATISTFSTTPTEDSVPAPEDIYNCLLFNISNDACEWGNLPTRVYKSILNEDPLVGVEDLGDIFTVMSENSFEPDKDSVYADAGDIDFVAGIETDIRGSDRVFNRGEVDIGPYELIVYKFFFCSSDIVSVYQDKLIIGGVPPKFFPTYGDIVFADLYGQFDDADAATEYSREAKIVINLRLSDPDYIIKSDKYDTEILRLPAYFDPTSSCLVVGKTGDMAGSVFSSVFDNDKYVFYFNELEHELVISLNRVYDKGCTGSANVVNKVRFGGLPVINR